jgi:hydroxyacylglutathione hydrolase
VPDYLHAVATLSLEAHLIKLVEDGRAHLADALYYPL